MVERFSTKTLGETFYPDLVRGENGQVAIAPPDAVAQYQNLKAGWLKNYRPTGSEVPLVSISPGEKGGRRGYFIRKQVQEKV